jgi:hypothetical protein
LSRRGDISNGALLALAVAGLAALPVWMLLRSDLPSALGSPGTPVLQTTAMIGALLLLVPVAYALAKRSSRTTRHALWLSVHAVAAIAGTVLVFVHAAGRLLEPPALLLVNLLALMALGLWARIRGARQMADTFATKHTAFAPADPARRERLSTLIREKQALLARLDPQASEATFSVTLAQRFTHPRLARQYSCLAAEEARLMGQRASVKHAQAWWRPLHLLLSVAFVAGLVLHIILVTFFAGWVVDGGEIYWWHVTSWGR